MRSSAHKQTLRPLLSRLHRYAGLTLAAFLVVSGTTGALISFNHELDEWLNPQFFHAEGKSKLTASQMVARVEDRDPRARVNFLTLNPEAGHSVSVFVEPRVNPENGQLYPLDYNEVFMNPASGEILGQRFWGAFNVNFAHLMPFIYQLHMSLHLPENWGLWLVGGVALLWFLDCFVGAYLTFPHGRLSFKKWKPSWKVKTNAGGQRVNYDLHRAGGLWFWALLATLAFSGVSFNLHEEVFEPVVSSISKMTPTVFDRREERPLTEPIPTRFKFDEMLARAKVMAAERGLPRKPNGMFYSAEFGVFGIGFGPEHGTGLGSPWIYLDGKTGRGVGAQVPGTGSFGDFLHDVQFPLHSGQIIGLLGRIIICLTGIIVAMLSITGVIVWWRRPRRAAGTAVVRAAAAPALSRMSPGMARNPESRTHHAA